MRTYEPRAKPNNYTTTNIQNSISSQDEHCQKLEINSGDLNISGQQILKHTSKIAINSESSKTSIKSGSKTESKNSEDFGQNISSSFNLDTPSFTEELNQYEFVTDRREINHDSVSNDSFHEFSRRNSKKNLDRAFILDDESLSNSSQSPDCGIITIKMVGTKKTCNRKGDNSVSRSKLAKKNKKRHD